MSPSSGSENEVHLHPCPGLVGWVVPSSIHSLLPKAGGRGSLERKSCAGHSPFLQTFSLRKGSYHRVCYSGGSPSRDRNWALGDGQSCPRNRGYWVSTGWPRAQVSEVERIAGYAPGRAQPEPGPEAERVEEMAGGLAFRRGRIRSAWGQAIRLPGTGWGGGQGQACGG